jgi:hypothetical protein
MTAMICYFINPIKCLKVKRKFKANKICFRKKMSIGIEAARLIKLSLAFFRECRLTQEASSLWKILSRIYFDKNIILYTRSNSIHLLTNYLLKMLWIMILFYSRNFETSFNWVFLYKFWFIADKQVAAVINILIGFAEDFMNMRRMSGIKNTVHDLVIMCQGSSHVLTSKIPLNIPLHSVNLKKLKFQIESVVL